MKTANKTQLIEATIAATAIIGLAAVVIPTVGVMAAAAVVGAGLFGMAALETKKRAY
ncbi:hypothetical protein [Pelagicoccus albus]|uniref:Uncharacterized protein n=1 Tax=Pelagicoccus albus TaxID=415222 RepID=A0A7X1EB15_9BACT|nr:hypothetical protein [Pelagicoccus albus]MBC2607312.1 hypothetical protein [Pelagicoccus albus]